VVKQNTFNWGNGTTRQVFLLQRYVIVVTRYPRNRMKNIK
jgi:hypothetical protein